MPNYLLSQPTGRVRLAQDELNALDLVFISDGRPSRRGAKPTPLPSCGGRYLQTARSPISASRVFPKPGVSLMRCRICRAARSSWLKSGRGTMLSFGNASPCRARPGKAYLTVCCTSTGFIALTGWGNMSNRMQPADVQHLAYMGKPRLASSAQGRSGQCGKKPDVNRLAPKHAQLRDSGRVSRGWIQ